MYSNCCMVLLLVIVLIDASDTGEPRVLHIGALFNAEHSSVNAHGQDDLQVAQLAIDEINHRHAELFHGLYKLSLLSNNSQCDPIYAVDAFFHAIFRRAQLLFLVGTSCSNETKAVIQVADYYNLILFSHSTSFISQSNQTYSSLVRLSVSDANYNDARVAFIKDNQWSHVAIIHQDSTDYSLMMAKLARRLNESNVNVILTQSASMLNLTSALRTLQEKKARIVFVNFDTSSRASFFCEVHQTFTEELRQRYVWILTGNDYDRWNFTVKNCTKQQIVDAARNHIIVDSSYERRASSINPAMTAEQLQTRLKRKDHLDRQTLHAFDAIWVIALLIRASIEQKIALEQFSYESMNIRDQWLTLVEQVYFLGVSGPVSFRNGQRRAETLISQFQIDGNEQHVEPIAEYSQDSGLNTNCSGCQSLTWSGITPVDTERSRVRQLVMSAIEIAVITGCCVLGLALAAFFLTFNIIHRHERYIKLSSPKLNNVMLIGAMHIHVSCLVFALDKWFLERHLLTFACMLRIFLFSGGFSLTFGSMFLKTLRVYRIFTSNDRPLLHSKLLQDQHLLLICLCLYGVDILSVTLWHLLDPQSVQFNYAPARRLDMDTVVIDEIYYCDSSFRHKILFLLYVYKASFLVMGGYLAAKTRHVHIPALNDSKFIVWSIYVVVLTTLFTAILMVSMKNLETYLLICLVVILMTSFIVCLVFLPKVIRLKYRDRMSNDVVSRELMVDDSRTRRLVIEINYFEKYRYAQLQNRELKSELVRLNHIQHTLEQKLDLLTSNVAMHLLPIAVRWASNFLQISDAQSSSSSAGRSTSKPSLDMTIPSVGEEQPLVALPDHASTSSDEDSERTLSLSSSDLDLSVVLQSQSDLSSLLLSALQSRDQSSADDLDTRSPRTPVPSASESESVLFLHLPNELHAAAATFDSDFERLDQ